MDGDDPGGDRAATRPRRDPPRGALYLVPADPGPLRRLDGDVVSDGLDRRIRSMLRVTTDAGPGWLDAVLLTAGAGFVAWALLGGGWGGPGALGAALLVIGGAIPVRGLLQDLSERRQARRIGRLLAAGAALDATNRSVAQLAAAYRTLVRDATRRGAIVPDGTLETAHGHLVEAAKQLQGRAPADAATRTRIEARATAIRELRATLGPTPATPTRRRAESREGDDGTPDAPRSGAAEAGHAGA